MEFFEVIKRDPDSTARLGVIHTAHGQVHTPAFLPIGTRGSVKAVTSEELRFWGAEMILANTYHLWLRPGDALINKAGGLHKFMGWEGPIFTDSGGYQVYSLGEKQDLSLRGNPKQSNSEIAALRGARNDRQNENAPILKRITEAGVEFRNELDGNLQILTPEQSIQIQSNLGSDIAVALDDVPGLPAPMKRLESSLDLTLKWAGRARKQFDKIRSQSLNPGQRLFAVVQGGDDETLRKKCVKALEKIGFDGCAIGGLAIGAVADNPEIMYRVISFTIPHLDPSKPRHLLGVGYPEQIIKAIGLGLDTFDCVIPTRNARHGQLFINKKPGDSVIARSTLRPVRHSFVTIRSPWAKEVSEGGSNPTGSPRPLGSSLGARDDNNYGYQIINILNKQYREDFTPVDNTCSCYGCLHHNRAYLRHLFMSGEPLGIRLATMHNLRFYLDLMEKIRRSIEYESFAELQKIYVGK